MRKNKDNDILKDIDEEIDDLISRELDDGEILSRTPLPSDEGIILPSLRPLLASGRPKASYCLETA